MRNVVLIGDELGLTSLYNSLENNNCIHVTGVICHKGRMAAEEVASEICSKLNCKLILQPRKSEVSEFTIFLEEIAKCRPDFGICNSYDMIMNKEVLNLFPFGIFNLHGALLPKYRGGNVLNWVIINGEKETGMTLHLMEETVDTGPIVLQKRVSVDFVDTALTLREKLRLASEELLAEFWKRVEEDGLEFHPQNEQEATYVPKRKPEDGYFEWSWDAERIYNLIRALISPWPGAFYFENGEKVVIDYYLTLDEVKRIKSEKG